VGFYSDFIKKEKNMKLVLWIVGINVVIFIIQNIVPGFTDAFVLNSDQVLSAPWTLITSIFLHADVMHILFNMFALLIFGLILENIIGSRRFIAIYFASGLLASIGSVFFYNSTLGASGAIFGVLGCLALLRPRMTVGVYFVPMPMVVAAGVWAVLDLVGVFYPSNVANIAHIIGLIIGILFGLLLREKFSEKREKRKYPLREEEMDKWENEYMIGYR
jgi:hypothetical protein